MVDSAAQAHSSPLSESTEAGVESVERDLGTMVRSTWPEASELVGRYRIRRLIGEGGMGRVYLARDTALGRSVALKLIKSERLGGGAFEKFLDEARTTAQLSHPHIVVVYDVGVHDGLPYLALEHLEGESLSDRILREAPSVDETLRILQSIARALDHAHAERVWHCDLKPSNVVLPSDGRVRVVDFGLALSGGVDGRRGAAGTPDYMAPEQWTGSRLSEKVDIWALGMMTYKLVASQHPFGAARSPDERRASVVDSELEPAAAPLASLPLSLSTLVMRSLARAAEARPSARDWCEVLDAALGSTALVQSPYRGLSAFHEEHASVFFGREAELESYLERLRTTPILPIVGPSGAGKSSFLRAGVIARLRARERWKILVVRPGAEPLRELALQLLMSEKGGQAPTRATCDRLAEDLLATPTLLALRLSTLAEIDSTRVLLAVDQLEEIFTHDVHPAKVSAFLQLLSLAADDTLEPIRVSITIRDDFVGRVPSFHEMFVLRGLGAEQLKRAILVPLERSGFHFEDQALPDEMVRDIGPTSAGLPMLQFACQALWEGRDEAQRVIRRETYDRLGGVAGALAHHADAILDGMSRSEQHVARSIFVRLVSGATTRRTVERSDLGAEIDGAEPVLDKLVAARLLVLREAPGAPSALVEVAHESLLSSWKRLVEWLDESRDERRLAQELDEAITLWTRRGSRAEETWPLEDIRSTRRRVASLGVPLTHGAENFLLTGEKRAASLARRRRWQVGGGIALATLAVTGSLAAASSYREQKVAAEERADSLRLASGNLGRVDLVLAPFDWGADGPIPVASTDLPDLTWRLHAASSADVHTAGDELPSSLVRRLSSEITSEGRIDNIEVPGGTAFLEIDGRGRPGEKCAPSWIRLQTLPGFAERERPARLRIRVPTCQATFDGMVPIPAGPFIYGGRGDPPTRFDDYVEPERVVVLASYLMDRTEVSNARFAPFAEMSGLSGYPVPAYPAEGVLHESDEPSRPVAGIDAYEAEAFCRFLGKRLPGDYEWTKAARGGTELDGRPNLAPRRSFPWGTRDRRDCLNVDGTDDGFDAPAPVDAFACGASPYGIINMAGNVAEWISKEGQVEGSLRVVRGGAYDSPPDLEQGTTVFRNTREGRYFWFGIGMRCEVSLQVDVEKQ